MASKYDALIDDVAQPTVAEPPPVVQDKYGALIDEVTDTTPLHNSLFDATGTNPDQEVKNLKLAKELNTPAAILPADAEQQALLKRNNADDLTARSPATAKFLAKGSNAKVTGLQGVKSLEDVEAAYKTYSPENIKRFIDNYTSANKTAGEAAQRLTEMKKQGINLADELDPYRRETADIFKDPLKAAAAGANTMIAGLNEIGQFAPQQRIINAAIDAITPKRKELFLDVQAGLNSGSEYWQGQKSPAMQKLNKEFEQAGIADSVSMLLEHPQLTADLLAVSTPYLVGGGLAAKGGATTVSMYNALVEAGDAANTARQEAIKAGASEEDQDRAATVAVLITAPTVFLGNKLLGAGKLEADFFTKGSVGDNLLKSAVKEALSGAIEEGSNKFSTNVAASTYDDNRQLLEGVGKAALIGGILESTHAVGMSVAERSLRTFIKDVDQTVTNNGDLTNKAAEATAAHDTLESLGAKVADNELRTRSPEAFHEFVETMADEQQLQDVYIDGKTMLNAIEAEYATLRAEQPELVARIEEAAALGNDVQLPVADYLTHIAGTPLEANVLGSLKADPAGATYKEAQAFYKDQADVFQSQVQAVAEANEEVLSREEFEKTKSETGDEKQDAVQQPSGVDGKATKPDALPNTYEEYLAQHKNQREVYARDVDTVETNLYTQFAEAKRFTPTVNRAYVAPLVEFYKVQAKKFGVMPSELLRQYPLKIQAFMDFGTGFELNQSQPATVNDFKPENVGNILTKDNWVILTPNDPNNTPTPEDNPRLQAEFVAELKAQGTEYLPVVGKYGSIADSFILFNTPPEQALELGRKWNQESVLTRDGFVYQDGSRQVATGVTVHRTAPEDYYTTVTLPDGTETIFTVDIDFSQRVPMGEMSPVNPELIDSLPAKPEVYQGLKVGQVMIKGVHYSNEKRTTLNGAYYGTGAKGAEADRVRASKDSRIKSRVHFYVDEGKGVFPEYGVGNVPHTVTMANMYDGARNPLRLTTRNADGERDMNLFESAVIDAGFDGYYIENGFGRQGVAVMLGDAARSVIPDSEKGTTLPDPEKVKARFAEELKNPDIEAIYNGRPDSLNGKVLNTDVARELSSDYLVNRSLGATVHEQSNKFIKKLYAKRLAEAPKNNELPVVLFTAGGTGAGKTSAILQGDPTALDDRQIVYDTNMATYESSKEKVEQALAAGKAVQIILTIRDPIDGFINGALKRAMRQEQEFGTGRAVPILNHASTYIGAPITVQKLAEDYKDDPRVSVRVLDNSFGKNNAVEISVANANKYVYNSQDELEQILMEVLKNEYEKGTISEAVARATAHTSRGNETNKIIKREDRQGDSQGPEQSGLVYQSTALRRGTETLKRYGLDPNKTHMTRDIAAALEARQREKYGSISATDRSPEAIKKIANWMAEEVAFEMQDPTNSGVGWYSEKFQRALDTMATEFPELATDKAARDTMTSLIAITSDGQKVFGNFAQAMDIYGNFKESGKFTTLRGHQRTASIVGNLENLQRLYDKMGPEVMHEYLMQEKTVSELKKIAKENGAELTTPYQAHIKLPMAAVEFGPKLGAFYANLMGAHGYLTMDRWWSRSFNRYRGTLLTKPTQVGLTRFKELMGNPEMSNDEAIAAVVKPAEAYIAKGFKNGTEIERAANTIYRAAFLETEDVPFNASDRTFMLDAVEKARQVLKRRGYDLSIADIQAILWYYEKRLYGDLGARQSADISYEEAAARVVAERAGISDGQQTEISGSVADSVPVGEELYQTEVIDQTQTPEFKAWFGDSKVVDADGKPLAVYHGTHTPDFDYFETPSYFTDHPKEASAYTFTNQIPAIEKALKRYTISEDTSHADKDVPYVGVLSDHTDLKVGGVYATDEGVFGYKGNGQWTAYANLEVDYDAPYSDVTARIIEGDGSNAVEKVNEYLDFVKTFPDGANGRVIPVYLSIKNPKELSALEGNLFGKRLDADDAEVRAKIAKYKSQGYDGIVTESDEARVSDEVRRDLGRVPKHYIPFDASQIKSAIGNNGNFDANNPSILEQTTRGSFNLDTLTMTMLQGADLSTVIHESGHFYLKMLETLAARADAPQEVKDDFQRTMDWFGVTSNAWQAMNLEQQRPYHEQWAESYERWNMEGKAPTSQLQPIFSRFRAWLVSVYKSIDEFVRLHPAAGKLNDEVRGVFSRLLASQEAIAASESARAYQPLYANAKDAGVSEETYASYIELGQQATQNATDDLQARSLRDMKWLTNARNRALQELQATAKETRAKVMLEVTKEVNAEPVYQAMRFLRRGETVDPKTGAAIKATKGYKLDAKIIDEMYPDTALDSPDLTKLRGMTMTDGLSPDIVAQMFGFSSGDAMVRELIEAENMNEKIEGLTDQRMLEEHGDLIDERSVQRAADEAVHNEARAKFMATGLKMLTKSPISVSQLSKAAKAAAETVIANKRVRDVKPKQFLAAETRANKEVMKLVAKKPQEAAEQQRVALLNNRLAAVAQDAVTEVEKALRYLGKFNNEGTRKNLDLEYLEQIDDLLEPFDLRKGLSLRTIDSRTTLAEWITEQEAMGFEPTIDPVAMAEAKTKSYKNMKMSEVRALVDTIKQIEHMGRMKKKLLTALDRADFLERINEAKISIALNANRVVEEKGTPSDALGILAQWGRQMLASHRKFTSFMRELDGAKWNGALYNLLVRPMATASSTETQMKAEAAERLAELFEPIRAKISSFGNLYNRKRVVPGTMISMTHEQRVMFAMNWGNEGNRQRLLDGGITGKKAMSQQEARAVLDTLTKEEWDFVQGIWDYIGTYKPLIEAQERQLTGKTPEWIEAAPVETKFGTYPGGYFPAKYDAVLSTRSDALEAVTDLRSAMKGAFGAAAARNGYTKERATQVKGRPLLLNFNAISRHTNEVIHRLAWQAWLVDANRVVRALDSDFRTHLGAEATKEISDAIRDIAQGDAPANTPVEVALNRVRTGTSIVAMGWGISTALLQPSGLSNSIARVGVRNMTKGLARFMANPIAASDWVNANSVAMQNRGRTMNREMNEILNTVRAGKGVSAVTGSFFYLTGKFQRMVDIPTYLGAYERALEELKYEEATSAEDRASIEKKAHDIAGQTVVDTQGGGEMKDLAKVQRGSPLYKLFTNFYSYMSTVYNQNVEAVRTTDFKNPAEIAAFTAEMLLINFFPVVFSVALKNALKGTCEWDDTECLAGRYQSEQISHLFGQMVGVREVGVSIDAATGGEAFGYTGPAGLRFFADVYKSAIQLNQGEADVALLKALNNALGALFHYPAGQLNKTLEGAIAIENGEVEGAAILPALISGPQK
jgi:ADP-Ribosyltransferase in polyvalent proteins